MKRIAAVALIACLAPCARAQVVANPNQIRGTYSLTNTNPAIVDLLQTQGFGGLSIMADSIGGTGLHASGSGARIDALHAAYELTVEGGVPGIAYDVQAMPSFMQATARSSVAASPPVEPEPAPDVTLDFADCMGAITVHLVDLAGAPVIGADVTVNGRRPPAGSNEMQWLAPDGTTVNFRVMVETGNDPLHDTMRLEYLAGSATARCDEFTAFDCVIDPDPCNSGSGVPIGSIVGNVDVLGADLLALGTPGGTYSGVTTQVSASWGPFGNGRLDILHDPGRLRGAYELENLLSSYEAAPPDPYQVTGRLALDLDGQIEYVYLPDLDVRVGDGEIVDLGDMFVIDPTDVHADVLIVGPPPSPLRGRAMLADSWLNATAYGSRQIAPGATVGSEGMRSSVGHVVGPYDDASSSLTAAWRLLAGGPLQQPSLQSFETQFFCVHADVPPVPNDWYSAGFSFGPSGDRLVELRPGERRDIDVRACVGQVLIGIRSTGAPFYAPRITATGHLIGVDFEGRAADRTQSATCDGLPATARDAATSGSVKLCLPEGDYRLITRATFVNPGGGTSNTQLQPIDLHVGCRQVITGSPQIVAQMTQSPSCAGNLPVTVGGSVTADESIASITWSTDGGPETDACRPCGINPSYEIDVPGTGADVMSVLVKATDVLGREATVTHFARAADEPSATDLDPSAAPLRVDRSGNSVRVTWQAAQGLSYSLYRGTIASLHGGAYDHAAFGACGLASPEWSGALPAGDSYLLATCACGFGDAALGRDSFGREIPGAGPRCP